MLHVVRCICRCMLHAVRCMSLRVHVVARRPLHIVSCTSFVAECSVHIVCCTLSDSTISTSSCAGVIAALQEASIGTVMITGDHARTAITVARAANILTAACPVVTVESEASGLMPTFSLTYLDSGYSVTSAGVTTSTQFSSCQITLDDVKSLVLRPSSPFFPKGPTIRLPCSLEYLQTSKVVITGAGLDAMQYLFEHGTEQEAELFHAVMHRVSVAARCQPLQKKMLVLLFMESGDFTAFVGDGANDTAALKAADIGLSLTTNAEASVAAPFTSNDMEITSILTVLLEGRAALSTSFQLFRFIALYAAVQFSNSLQMNLLGSYLSELEFLYVDLIVVMPLCMLIPMTGAYHTLTSRRVASSLLNWQIIVSIIGQAIVCVVFQLAARQLLRNRCWFQEIGFQLCATDGEEKVYVDPPPNCPEFLEITNTTCITYDGAFSNIVPSYENTALWQVCSWQYLVLIMVFSAGPPFRKPQYTNWPFMAAWLILAVCTGLLLLVQGPWVDEVFQFLPYPSESSFKWEVAALIGGSTVFAFAVEWLVGLIDKRVAANSSEKGGGAPLAVGSSVLQPHDSAGSRV